MTDPVPLAQFYDLADALCQNVSLLDYFELLKLFFYFSFKETIKLLLAAGGKFCGTLGSCLNNVNSPLHTAVELESKEAIEELLDAGASPICLNENGLTALHVCVEKRLKELLQVSYLLKNSC